jgi:Secretion system C-terminal sorting domain
MKKTLLFAALSLASIGNSQSLTQANEAPIGSLSTMYLCDSFTVDQEGLTGMGITWDFTGLAGYYGETRDVTVTDATTAPNAVDFPTSVTAVSVGGSLVTYFNNNATEKVSQGFVFNEPTLGDVVAKFSGDNETVVTYPFAYGSSLTDIFSGTLDFTFSGSPQTAPATGVTYASIDGQGTLDFPNGVSIPDVIRYKIVDTSLTTIILIGDLEIIRTQFEYYDPNVAVPNLPILTFTKITVQNVGAPAPISELSMVLSAYEPEYLNVAEQNSVDFTVYPNPSNSMITITGELGSEAMASIVDQSGRTLTSLSVVNGSTVDISSFENGMYFLKIEDNGSSTTKTIVKK